MFDVAFSELIIIAIIALIFVGPERLPGVARTLGHLLGRARRYVNDVKADIEKEFQLEDLKQLRSQFQEAALSIESEVRQEMKSAHTELQASLRENPETPAEAQSPEPPTSEKPNQAAKDAESS